MINSLFEGENISETFVMANLMQHKYIVQDLLNYGVQREGQSINYIASVINYDFFEFDDKRLEDSPRRISLKECCISCSINQLNYNLYFNSDIKKYLEKAIQIYNKANNKHKISIATVDEVCSITKDANYPSVEINEVLFKNLKNTKIDNIKSSLFTSTACGRGFRALFEIRNDSLFLQKAYGKENIDLFMIFGKKDNIFVDWYSGILTSTKNCLIYEHDSWGGFYEYETDFSIRNGILIRTQEFHNEIKPSPYTNSDTLMSFIKKNINYKNIRSVVKTRVVVKIEEVDNDGKITKVSILKGSKDNDFNNEAIRVIKSIPKWQVIVRRGKNEHQPWVVPIVFE